MTTGTKRNHVVFSEGNAPSTPAPSNGPVIHPSRAAAAAALSTSAGPPAKKTKVSSHVFTAQAYSARLTLQECKQKALSGGQGEETPKTQSCQEGFCAEEQGRDEGRE